LKPAKSPVDLRPFRSKADHASQQSLVAHYRRLAIPELVAALALMTGKNRRPAGEG
jgi:hypothetical protein